MRINSKEKQSKQQGTQKNKNTKIQKIQNLYPRIPTAVAKLLQYSGLGSNTGMGFLRTNDL